MQIDEIFITTCLNLHNRNLRTGRKYQQLHVKDRLQHRIVSLKRSLFLYSPALVQSYASVIETRYTGPSATMAAATRWRPPRSVQNLDIVRPCLREDSCRPEVVIPKPQGNQGQGFLWSEGVEVMTIARPPSRGELSTNLLTPLARHLLPPPPFPPPPLSAEPCLPPATIGNTSLTLHNISL